jgi:murein L,D-transpeptidase YcbB/YkuD
MGFKVYGAGVDAPEVDAATVPWARLSHSYFPYRLRQAPGPLNALGRYKFMFPNKFSVYLHDTPARNLFAKAERAFSSGCIRVEDPAALARFLVGGVKEWTPDKLRQAVESGETQTVVLAERVPVHILYWTAWAEDDEVVFRRDVYGRDARVLAALGEEPPEEESLEVSP